MGQCNPIVVVHLLLNTSEADLHIYTLYPTNQSFQYHTHNMLTLPLVSVTARVAFILATHAFTLVNHCSYSIPVYVDNAYSSVPYVSPGVMCKMMKKLKSMCLLPSIDWAAARGTIGTGSSVNLAIPNGWNLHICHNADTATYATPHHPN
jgi:hypothetical protein